MTALDGRRDRCTPSCATGRGQLQNVVGRARVAIGENGDLFQQARAVADNSSACSARSSSVTISSHGQRPQRVDLGAREQRRDHFERRIFRGRADQDDVAALDVGQKGVLLGFVEAVNFIDEHHRAAPAARAARSASAITALISLMPLSTALKGMNSHG